MPRVLVLILTVGLICWGSLASAVEIIKFDESGLGLPWNASAAELEAIYPGTKLVSQRAASYRGPLEIDTLHYDAATVAFRFDRDNRLERISCVLRASDATRLVQLLSGNLGPARWATYQDVRLFQHVYEWSEQAYTLELGYTGLTADALAAPYDRSDVILSLSRDRPRVTQVDAASSLPQRTKALQEQAAAAQRQAEEQREARRQEAERVKALPVNSPERPTLRRAESTWGRVFNPSGEVPLGTFKAFYFDTDAPRLVVGSELVKDVAINYAWDEFLKIKSENFGGYWVGRIQVPKAQTRLIGISQSHAKTRIVIDGLVAFEGGSDASVPYEFSKGEHRVEIEHVNRWHTTEFKVTFGSPAPLMTMDEIRAELERLGVGRHDVQYVGVYESRNKDLSIALSADMLRRDTVLVLSSYAAIRWSARDPKSHIKAVVVGSHAPGTEVTGLSRRVPVLQHKGTIAGYSIETRCDCHGGRFHCENAQSLQTLQDTIARVSGGTLAGFAGAYGITAVTLPGAPLDAAAIESDRRQVAATEAQRSRCERKLDPDFERMLQ